MNSAEFRASMAGFLDSATMLTRAVVEALRVGENTPGEGGKPRKVECPPAVYEQLMDAEKRLQQVAAWLLDPANTKLEG